MVLKWNDYFRLQENRNVTAVMMIAVDILYRKKWEDHYMSSPLLGAKKTIIEENKYE
jgi:hypothetical protein